MTSIVSLPLCVRVSSLTKSTRSLFDNKWKGNQPLLRIRMHLLFSRVNHVCARLRHRRYFVTFGRVRWIYLTFYLALLVVTSKCNRDVRVMNCLREETLKGQWHRGRKSRRIETDRLVLSTVLCEGRIPVHMRFFRFHVVANVESV